MTQFQRYQIAQWEFDGQTGELSHDQQRVRLEPKAAALLSLLAANPDQLLSREQIIAQVWSDTIVGEDALARAIFKLRRALGDDSKAARFIETIPKRGYRMIAAVAVLERSMPAVGGGDQKRHALRGVLAIALVFALSAAVLVWMQLGSASDPSAAESDSVALVERAQDFYYRYSRADNEAAIELYERILAREPDKVDALAGLSNALVQRVIRWPQLDDGRSPRFTSLTDALANGHLQQLPFQRVLERAQLLAERAITLDPNNPLLHRSLGLVLAAQAQLEPAIEQYRRAIELDPDAWGAMINLGEMFELSGKSSESLAMFMDAYAAMTRRYQSEKQHIMPWYADLAVLIGDRLQRERGQAQSEDWYRRALLHSPLHPAATVALAGLLQSGGRGAEATQLCAELEARVGSDVPCPRSTTP